MPLRSISPTYSPLMLTNAGGCHRRSQNSFAVGTSYFAGTFGNFSSVTSPMVKSA